MTSSDLIHVGEVAPDSEPCAVCGEASDDCGDTCGTCGTCENPVTGSYQLLCAECAELNQQADEAMLSRMRKICIAIDEALEVVQRIDERGFSGPLMMEQFGRLARLGSILRSARQHVPANVWSRSSESFIRAHVENPEKLTAGEVSP
jgi:hypothetical protein